MKVIPLRRDRLNPGLTFTYVSGQGTDGSEQGRTMWARVTGKTENDRLALPMKAYVFRPGLIQPLHGVQPKVRTYALLYKALGPVAALPHQQGGVWPDAGVRRVSIPDPLRSDHSMDPPDVNAAFVAPWPPHVRFLTSGRGFGWLERRQSNAPAVQNAHTVTIRNELQAQDASGWWACHVGVARPNR